MTAEKQTIPLENQLGTDGTLSFEMTPAETFQTGDTPQRRVQILDVPGFATLTLRQSDDEPVPDPGVLWLMFSFDELDNTIGILDRQFTELTGGETYHVQITWDASRNLIDGYVDGNPIVPPGQERGEWDVTEHGDEVVVPENDIEVSNVTTRDHYVPDWRAPEIVPAPFRRRNPDRWGLRNDDEPLSVADRKGDLLYSNELSDPADIADWPPIEGPGTVEFEDDWLHMWSPDDEYHHVLWCPENFPDRFVAEWEVKIASKDGLCIVFFAATGPDGEDIFDPDMPERTTGDFDEYNGGLNAYHISYFAGQGRITANMRKDGYDESRPADKRFYLMDQGPVGILPGSNEPHTVRVIKDGGHIQLQIDGEVHLDVTDDSGDRFGDRYQEGKIGFRQMVPTQGYYRNLRVWELTD